MLENKIFPTILLNEENEKGGAKMKYVLLGNIAPEWAAKQADRSGQAIAKSEELGIKIENIYYTQGQFDFVTIADAPDMESVLALSIWYADNGFGQIRSMPAFDSETMERAIGKL